MIVAKHLTTLYSNMLEHNLCRWQSDLEWQPVYLFLGHKVYKRTQLRSFTVTFFDLFGSLRFELIPQDHWALQQGAGGLRGQQDRASQDRGIPKGHNSAWSKPFFKILNILSSDIAIHVWSNSGGEEIESDDPGQEVPGDPRPGDWRAHHLHQGVQVDECTLFCHCKSG